MKDTLCFACECLHLWSLWVSPQFQWAKIPHSPVPLRDHHIYRGNFWLIIGLSVDCRKTGTTLHIRWLKPHGSLYGSKYAGEENLRRHTWLFGPHFCVRIHRMRWAENKANMQGEKHAGSTSFCLLPSLFKKASFFKPLNLLETIQDEVFTQVKLTIKYKDMLDVLYFIDAALKGN